MSQEQQASPLNTNRQTEAMQAGGHDEGLQGRPEAHLLLDDQTCRDLEIFEAPSQDGSLFALCNFTRSRASAKVLRRRMERPWADASRIRSVQLALRFILTQRQHFDPLTTQVDADNVDYYLRGNLPLITSGNVLEFFIEGLQLRFGDQSRFGRIHHGVEHSCSLIRALRETLSALSNGQWPESQWPGVQVRGTQAVDPEQLGPEVSGELAAILAEMAELLQQPGIARVPAKASEKGLNTWSALRLDQVFRMHEKVHIDRLLKLANELDCLLAMADATRHHGFTMPEILEGPLAVEAESLVHPFVREAVANPLKLNQRQRLLFLTGPNMAGKTTYLRAAAIALYLAHLGMGVPARRFRFVPAQRLFSSISLTDNLRDGISFFRAEALRVKDIARAVAKGQRVIAMLDEPFKGTNVRDALDASRAILERLATKPDCLFLFSSHLIELSQQMSCRQQVDCRYFEAREEASGLSFDYVLRPGVSRQRLGMRVLQDEGIFALLDGSDHAAENPQAGSRAITARVPGITGSEAL